MHPPPVPTLGFNDPNARAVHVVCSCEEEARVSLFIGMLTQLVNSGMDGAIIIRTHIHLKRGYAD